MKRLALMVLAACVCAGLSGCGDSGPKKTAGGKTIVKLGANLEMTGENSQWGQDSDRGIRLALDEINAADKNFEFQVVTEDNKSEPSASKNAITKLVSQDQVLAVMGSVSSVCTLSAVAVAKSDKVPLMSHASTRVGIPAVSEYVSRICFADDFQGGTMAKFARNSMKFDTVLTVRATGNPYSEGLCESFKKSFAQLGGKNTEELAYPPKAQDFRTIIARIKEINPQAVWLPGYHNEVALLIKQAREAGLQIPFMGADGWDNPALFEIAGPAIKGNYFSNHFDPSDPNPKVQEFVKKFQDKFKLIPGAMAALAYDAMYAMADSARRAKELTPEGMKNAINSIKGLQGVCGTISMGPDREVVKDCLILETGEKKYIYKETIKP